MSIMYNKILNNKLNIVFNFSFDNQAMNLKTIVRALRPSINPYMGAPSFSQTSINENKQRSKGSSQQSSEIQNRTISVILQIMKKQKNINHQHEDENEIDLLYYDKLIKDYERKTNLSLQKFINSCAPLIQIDEAMIHNTEPQYRLPLIKNLIQLKELSLIPSDWICQFIQHNCQLPLIQYLYIQNYFASQTALNSKTIQAIMANVQKNPEISMLVNIIYETDEASQEEQKNISISSLESIMPLLNTQEYSGINPLKFLWSAYQLNRSIFTQNSLYFLKQLSKVSISKLTSSEISRIIFSSIQQSSIIVLTKYLFQSSKTLSILLKKWSLSLLIFSKLQTYNQPEQIAVNLYSHLQLGSKIDPQLVFQIIPQILYEKNPLYFSLYQRALQNKEGQNVGKKEKDNLQRLSQTIIKYEHVGDPKPIIALSLSEDKAKDVQKNEKETSLSLQQKAIKCLVREDYESFFSYLKIKKASLNENYSRLQILENKALQQFQDTKYSSLFMIKNIMKQSINFEEGDIHLTSNILHNSLTDERNSESDQDDTKRERRTSFYERKDSKLTGGLFKKREGFCTNKPETNNYNEYLQNVKTIEQEVSDAEFYFNFQECKSSEQIYSLFKTNIQQINRKNLPLVLKKYENIPFLNNILYLIKYEFLKGKSKRKILNTERLNIDLDSSFGKIQKNYGTYLQYSEFLFALPEEVYGSLLRDQTQNYNRKFFKKIISHMIFFKKQISPTNVQYMCEICRKQKIGLTLIQILSLITSNKIVVNYESLFRISGTVQSFKNLYTDLISFLNNYIKYSKQKLNSSIFKSYIHDLIINKNFSELGTLYDNLRQQIRPKEYKFNQSLSNQENIEAQKRHKLKERSEYYREFYTMVTYATKTFSQKTREIPSFLVQLFEQFQQEQEKLTIEEYGTGFLVYAKDKQKYLKLLSRLENDAQNNTKQGMKKVFESMQYFPKDLREHVLTILKATIYKNKLQLNEDDLLMIGKVFVKLDQSVIFAGFLEYILMQQCKLNNDIKHFFYGVLNESTDDQSKGQVISLLELLFNPKQEKQKIKFREIREDEQNKTKLIQKQQQALLQEGKKVVDIETVIKAQNTKANEKKRKKKGKKQIHEQIKQGDYAQFMNSMIKKTIKSKRIQRRRKLVYTVERFILKIKKNEQEETPEPQQPKKLKGENKEKEKGKGKGKK